MSSPLPNPASIPGDLPVAYTVSARHPSPASVDRYIAWLAGGHVQAVIRGGASSATIVRQQEPDPLRIEVRYVFPNREAFDRYVREFAPALRAEGLALFGPDSGVEFVRSLGVIAEQMSAFGS